MSKIYLLMAALAVAFALLAWLVMAGQTAGVDTALLLGLRGDGEPGALMAAVAQLTHLGDSITLAIFTLIAVGLLLKSGQRRAALYCLFTAAGGFIITAIGKAAFGRARPDIIEQFAHATSASFPSGHTLRSAVVYSLIAYILLQSKYGGQRFAILVVAGALILMNGDSRVYLGVHWPTDILGSWLLAAIWLMLSHHLYSRGEKPA